MAKTCLNSLRFGALLAALLLSLPASVLARDVKDTEKLELLRQATGESDRSGIDFQQRLDSIMETDSSATRDYVADREDAESARILAQENAEALVEAQARPPVTERVKTSVAEEEEKAREKEAAALKPLDTRTDASEWAYQEERNKILEDTTKAKTAPQTGSFPAGASQAGALAPSLANNPFYFKEANTERDAFEMNKPVVLNRLVQNGVMSEDDARNLVQGTVSQDDLILALMNDQGMTYGEASDIARNS